jgi:uncharacterized protein with HEPN domain
VDLVTPKAIKPRMKPYIMQDLVHVAWRISLYRRYSRVLWKSLEVHEGNDLQRLRPWWLHFDAVLRNLEIIGEAVKNISEGTRQKYPKIKWRKIAGFRDIVAHEYFGIDDETVWDIVENEVPALLAMVKTMLGENNS